MNIYRFLATIIMTTGLCLVAYQSAFAQGMGRGDPHPDSSVDGRTYCSVLTQTILRSESVVVSGMVTSVLAVADALPEHLACAAWAGFLRGLVAQAGGVAAHVHDEGRA